MMTTPFLKDGQVQNVDILSKGLLALSSFFHLSGLFFLGVRRLLLPAALGDISNPTNQPSALLNKR